MGNDGDRREMVIMAERGFRRRWRPCRKTRLVKVRREGGQMQKSGLQMMKLTWLGWN